MYAVRIKLDDMTFVTLCHVLPTAFVSVFFVFFYFNFFVRHIMVFRDILDSPLVSVRTKGGWWVLKDSCASER